MFSELFESAPNFFLYVTRAPSVLGHMRGGTPLKSSFSALLQTCKGGAEISHTYHMIEQLCYAVFIWAYIIFQTLGFH